MKRYKKETFTRKMEKAVMSKFKKYRGYCTNEKDAIF